jgi:hypothetical protein
MRINITPPKPIGSLVVYFDTQSLGRHSSVGIVLGVTEQNLNYVAWWNPVLKRGMLDTHAPSSLVVVARDDAPLFTAPTEDGTCLAAPSTGVPAPSRA